MTRAIRSWRRSGMALLSVLSLAALAGCGSSSKPTVSATSDTPSATATTSEATSSVPEPKTSGPTGFVLTGKTKRGDAVRMEGRFGSVLSASEAEAEQPALSDCPGLDGREIVVRLDMVVTLTSSLAGDVTVSRYAGDNGESGHYVYYLTDLSGEPQCPGEYSAPLVNLGELQPNAPVDFSVWAVLTGAISPNEPEPTEATLARERWLMGIPTVSVDETTVSTPDEAFADEPGNPETTWHISGDRVVRCDPEPEQYGFKSSLAFLALVKGTSTKIRQSDPDREELCEEPEE